MPASESQGTRNRILEGNGMPRTAIGRYTEKQSAWTKAQGQWDDARKQAIGKIPYSFITDKTDKYQKLEI
jgi:hypothetical protein